MEIFTLIVYFVIMFIRGKIFSIIKNDLMLGILYS